MTDSRRAHLVQLLLPLTDNHGHRFEAGEFSHTRQELIDRFGGLTAYQRAPARGLWASEDGTLVADEVVIFEVVVPDLDRGWWRRYRETLERRFRQDTLLVRAMPIETL